MGERCSTPVTVIAPFVVPVEVEQAAEVDGGDEVAVGDHDGPVEVVGEQRQRARGAHRRALAHVVQRHAEVLAGAEAFLEHVGLVVEREVHVAHACGGHALDEALDDRQPADLEQRLGHLVGEGTQPLALPPTITTATAAAVSRVPEIVE